MPALNRVCVPIKRGDNGQYRNGMPICHIDEAMWGIPLEKIISQFCSQAYFFMLIDRNQIPFFRAATMPILDTAKSKPECDVFLHPRSTVINYADLETDLGISGLKDRIASTESLGIIDGTRISTERFKDIRAIGLPADTIPDAMSVSNGLYTFGSGGDYATATLFFADVAATLTGNITGTQISDVTETANVNYSGALAGKSFTVDCAKPHRGNILYGYIMSVNHISHNIIFGCSSSSAAIIRVKNLHIKEIGAPTGRPVMVYLNPSAGANITHYAHDIIVDSNSLRCAGFLVTANSGTGVHKLYNCIVANADKTLTGLNGAFGYFSNNTSSATRYENCVALNMKYGFWYYGTNSNWVVNTYAANCDLDYSSGATPTGGWNGNYSATASSDTTSPSSAGDSKASANELLSVDTANANFGLVKAGGYCDNGGTAPSITGHTYGIRGNNRPTADATYSIGSDQYKSNRCLVPAGIF